MGIWPNKTVTQMTNNELATGIEQNQNDPNAATQQIVQGCWRELERRHGLADSDD